MYILWEHFQHGAFLGAHITCVLSHGLNSVLLSFATANASSVVVPLPTLPVLSTLPIFPSSYHSTPQRPAPGWATPFTTCPFPLYEASLRASQYLFTVVISLAFNS